MRVTLGGGSHQDGWIRVHPDPAVDAEVHLPPVEFVREHGEQIEHLEVGNLDERSGPVLQAAVRVLAEGAVVSGTSSSGGTPEELARRLEAAGLRKVNVRLGEGRQTFVALAPGVNPRADEGGAVVPENLENEPRPVIAEAVRPDPVAEVLEVEPETEQPPATGWKGRLRQAAAARLPEGSREREVARAGLTTYREVRNTTERLREAWAIPGAFEPREPSYRAFLRRHEDDARQSAEQRTYSRKVDNPCPSARGRAARQRRRRRDGRDAREPARSDVAAVDRLGARAPPVAPVTTSGSPCPPPTGARSPSGSTRPSRSPPRTSSSCFTPVTGFGPAACTTWRRRPAAIRWST